MVEHLASFTARSRFEDLDQQAVAKTEHAILDTLASLIGGVPTDNATKSRAAARATFGDGSAPVWFTQTCRLHPIGALFANCAAASALDVDDGHCLAAGHPGAAIVPAVLAEALASGRDGKAILAASAIGYDIALRIAAARIFTDTMSFASGQWTGFGVAAAIGWLRSLPENNLAHAIAIAGAEAPVNLPQGDCQASSVKGSSPWSTVAASFAVDRAASGMSGSLDMLDRPHAYRVPGITQGLGQRWLVSETYLKPYASCRYTHPVIDAVLKLRTEIGDASTIERFSVELFSEGRKLPNEIAPKSLEGAQFSVPFTAALAALRGASAFRPLRPESLADADVLRLAEKVSITYPEEFAGIFPRRTPARVTIMVRGRSFIADVPLPLGDASHPLDESALVAKLVDLADGILSVSECDRLVEAVFALSTGRSGPLLSMLQAHRVGV
ncbi:MmgE/PrpD family protein [Mesorhizobium sp. IMUNJ 23232]|uniref:MmgE/PrpD family protein n=1 Tax=Mesorhizobium sp. IMUNJ 23232 TaxID=3376064 RepID=UPI00379665B7